MARILVFIKARSLRSLTYCKSPLHSPHTHCSLSRRRQNSPCPQDTGNMRQSKCCPLRPNNDLLRSPNKQLGPCCPGTCLCRRWSRRFVRWMPGRTPQGRRCKWWRKWRPSWLNTSPNRTRCRWRRTWRLYRGSSGRGCRRCRRKRTLNHCRCCTCRQGRLNTRLNPSLLGIFLYRVLREFGRVGGC